MKKIKINGEMKMGIGNSDLIEYEQNNIEQLETKFLETFKQECRAVWDEFVMDEFNNSHNE